MFSFFFFFFPEILFCLFWLGLGFFGGVFCCFVLFF